MALGETAALVASLQLKDEFSKTADKFGRTVGAMERQTSTLGRIGGQVNSGLKNTALNLTRIGVIGGGLLAVAVKSGLESLQELEQVQTATNTVIASTAGVAGVSAEKVRKLAEEYESLNATMDDKVIQSGENLLLTFTNITDKAFEPALQAALDMNEALGGGPEGLQGTIIQVGKALQDPIRGFTALRRVGVNLSTDQQKQIKQLVAQNDLYGAQQIILKELTTEFGGRFAAAGDTAQGKFAKLKDAIEDAQMSLATAFLPVLTKVSDKLSTFLADPKVQRQIEDFGKGLAGGLDQVIEFAGRLPWSAIGDAFKIAGTGAKAVLDAFSSLPPWVQTAVLTGWGLNKLTGGALGGIAGTLGKALIGNFAQRGSTPANPLFTKEVGLPGVGGGAPIIAGGGASLLTRLALGAGAVVGGVVIGKEIAQAINESVITPSKTAEQAKVTAILEGDNTHDMVQALQAIEGQLNTSDIGAQTALIASRIPFIGDAIGNVAPELERQRDTLRAQLREQGYTNDQIDALVRGTTTVSNSVNGTGTATRSAIDKLRSETRALRDPINALKSGISTTAARTQQHLRQIEGVERGVSTNTANTAASTAAVSRKNFSPTLNARITVNNTVSVSDVVRAVTSHSIAVGVRGGLPEGV